MVSSNFVEILFFFSVSDEKSIFKEQCEELEEVLWLALAGRVFASVACEE